MRITYGFTGKNRDVIRYRCNWQNRISLLRLSEEEQKAFANQRASLNEEYSHEWDEHFPLQWCMTQSGFNYLSHKKVGE